MEHEKQLGCFGGSVVVCLAAAIWWNDSVNRDFDHAVAQDSEDRVLKVKEIDEDRSTVESSGG